MLHRRAYASRKAYVRHQRSKLPLLMRAAWGKGFARRRRAFALRLRHLMPYVKAGGSVLCLGARLGEEVAAFRDLGFEAVGIDLNPGPDNDLVSVGDFHNLAQEDGSLDLVYTNSLDHAWNLGAVAAECRRVLKRDGVLVVELGTAFEAIKPKAHLRRPNTYESILWDRASDLTDALEGFAVKTTFKNPSANYRTFVMEAAG